MLKTRRRKQNTSYSKAEEMMWAKVKEKIIYSKDQQMKQPKSWFLWDQEDVMI